MTHQERNEVVGYRVTGVLYNSKRRFTLNFKTLLEATSINLWNGSIWAILENGKKKLIRRVIN